MTDYSNTRVTVNIYGVPYKLKAKSETSAEYMHLLARYVDKQMRDIHERNRNLDISKLAVLASVNLCADYFKLKEAMEDQQTLLQNFGNVRSKLESYVSESERLLAELQQRVTDTEVQLSDANKRVADLEQGQAEALKSDVNVELQAKYDTLEDEYTKLKSEFDEWISMTEEDLD